MCVGWHRLNVITPASIELYMYCIAVTLQFPCHKLQSLHGEGLHGGFNLHILHKESSLIMSKLQQPWAEHLHP